MFAYGQKGFNVEFSHYFGMMFVVEENKASDPLHVVFSGLYV